MRAETALWLLPEEQTLAQLASQIEFLAHRFGSTAFVPHVTVFGGLTGNSEETLAVLRDEASRRAPFALPPLAVAHSALFFQCLVLDFGPAREVLALRDALGPRLGKKPGEAARPHLSLLYAELPEPERARLATAIELPQEIRFDRLRLVAPADGLAGWRDVAGWREVGTVGLGGLSLLSCGSARAVHPSLGSRHR